MTAATTNATPATRLSVVALAVRDALFIAFRAKAAPLRASFNAIILSTWNYARTTAILPALPDCASIYAYVNRWVERLFTRRHDSTSARRRYA